MAKNFNKNNLSNAPSPYLRQHDGNPIWWQPWEKDVIDHAVAMKKPIFVSVGYSTCHWCHVMAQEAFSDTAIADFLNKNFICIKVDREERPDIDSYLMHFLVAIDRSGGWPLNAFLTPELNPIFALTYAPAVSQPQVPGFLDIIQKVKTFYEAKGETLKPFIMESFRPPANGEEELIQACYTHFDSAHGGFGTSQKFPPHTTLLFLLYYSFSKDKRIDLMLEKTLDTMITGGIFDHLQGGIFRYCVDRDWTLPHFEKMLYDQAFGLWVYSMAYRKFGKPEYKTAALKVIQCLEDKFFSGGLYCSSFDADSDHTEGGAYLWDYSEIENVLTAVEFERFKDLYTISPEGRFDGKNHLVKTRLGSLEDTERRLLFARNKRPQPFTDKKIITSWNALVGCAYVHAFRYLGDRQFLDKAVTIGRNLVESHFDGLTLARCSINETISGIPTLEDGAAMLLLFTFLAEETGEHLEVVNIFYAYLNRFRTDKGWRETVQNDFLEVPAAHFDHPIPSSVSLAEWAITRANILLKIPQAPASYAAGMHHDAFNIVVMIRNGLFHILTSPGKVAWDKAPLNSIQVKGDRLEDCFAGSCRPISF